jgi:c-di-GMP-binding flagellar brake protein YcgR
MGNRLEPRVETRLTVEVSGIDADGNRFTQTAHASDVSRRGARLDGIGCLRGPGETIEVEHRGRKAKFFVAWVGNPGMPEQGHIGIRNLDRNKDIWKLELPKPQADDFAGAGAEVADAPQPAVSPTLPLQSEPPISPATGDRRKYRRYAIKGSAEFRVKGSDVPMAGKLLDLSPGGCYVKMLVPCDSGTQLEMALEVSGVRVLVEGVVKVVYPALGIGVEFTELTEENRQNLNRVTDTTSGGLRRRYARTSVAVQAEIRSDRDAAPLHVKTVDLSCGGCYIEMMFTLPVGTKLEMGLHIDDVKVKTGGIVVTCHPQVGNGIEFTDMAAEDQLRVKRFLAAIQETSSAEQADRAHS